MTSINTTSLESISSPSRVDTHLKPRQHLKTEANATASAPIRSTADTIKDLVSTKFKDEANPLKIEEGKLIAKMSAPELSKELESLLDIFTPQQK